MAHYNKHKEALVYLFIETAFMTVSHVLFLHCSIYCELLKFAPDELIKT